MSRLRCKIGIHDYEKNFEDRTVQCRHCDTHYTDLERLLIDREHRARMKMEAGRWDEATAEDFIEDIWTDD